MDMRFRTGLSGIMSQPNLFDNSYGPRNLIENSKETLTLVLMAKEPSIEKENTELVSLSFKFKLCLDL